jgi:predicted RNase H-like HicB family nuclease
MAISSSGRLRNWKRNSKRKSEIFVFKFSISAFYRPLLASICYNSNSKERGGNMSIYKLSVVIEKDSDGYFASCPELQGCCTQGDTYEEVLVNIKDAIRLHIEDRIECGEDIPQSESVSLTMMEVAV